MKLLIVTTVPATLRAFLLPYADNFRALGWRVDCLSNGAASDEVCAAHFDKCFDVDWSRNPLSPSNMVVCPPKIREIVGRERYDIVHVHTPVAAFVTRFALRNLRKKIGTRVIYTAHGFHFYNGGGIVKNFIFKTMEKIAARWTNNIIVMNEEDFAAAKTFYPAEMVTKMNGIGIDLNYYSRKDTSPPREKLFLSVAEFIPRKCHSDILRALALIKENNFHVAFAGTGALMDEMKELAKNLKISDKVHFLGFQKDVRQFIQSSSALILVSKHEGLPRSVMEGMAMGTPVIGSDIRGNRDLLGHGCGILVPVGDAQAIARAMIFCADERNAPEIEKITRAATKKILQYRIEELIKEHEKIYEEVNIVSTMLQIEVSDEIGKMVSLRAKEFGISLSSFVGGILGNFLDDNDDISKFQPNEETLAAMAEYREGKCREYNSVEELLADTKNG